MTPNACAAGSGCFRSSLVAGPLCLPKGSHILFLGDSIHRYQWLTLAYALVYGQEYAGSTDGRDLLHNEKTHCVPFPDGTCRGSSWTRFLNSTNAALNAPSRGARAFCDCFRSNSYRQWGSRMQHIVENRYLELGHLKLTFINVYGRNEVRGWWWPGKNDSMRYQRINDRDLKHFANAWVEAASNP
mgnify:CR=1 FL=1